MSTCLLLKPSRTAYVYLVFYDFAKLVISSKRFFVDSLGYSTQLCHMLTKKKCVYIHIYVYICTYICVYIYNLYSVYMILLPFLATLK